LLKQTSAVILFSPLQQASWLSRRRVIGLFWMGAVLTVVVLACVGPIGWDAHVLWKTIQAVHQHSDPFAEDRVILQAFHNPLESNPVEHPPLVYVYPPITLPLLRLLAILPGWLMGLLYVAAIAMGALLQIWAGYQLADKRERRWLALLLPAIVFFPGLVTDDVILSGNVAYVLYGVILAAATVGWKRGIWSWYYIAVLAASICKAPFLAMLAFPVLIDKRQWVPSGMTAITGVLVFGVQLWLWPVMFREYILNLRLVFDWLHDFGYGPVPLLGRAMWRHGLPSSLSTTLLYVVIACVLGVVLLSLARRVREWNLPRKTWIPVALVGTVLLNPRIMKYDLAAITIPMLLIGVRTLRFVLGRGDGERRRDSRNRAQSDRKLILTASACFLIPNLITVAGPSWVPVEFATLLAIFAMGLWSLQWSLLSVRPRSLGLDLSDSSRLPRELVFPSGALRAANSGGWDGPMIPTLVEDLNPPTGT
jgi:hypothetical protein